MGLDLSADSITISQVPFRYTRVGNIKYIVLFAGCLGCLAALLLISGAILTAVVYTEVRPPTADENYKRYIGSDFRRVIGPLMMCMSLFMIGLGCVLMVAGFFSARKDRSQLLAMSRDTEMDSFKVRTSLGEFKFRLPADLTPSTVYS